VRLLEAVTEHGRPALDREPPGRQARIAGTMSGCCVASARATSMYLGIAPIDRLGELTWLGPTERWCCSAFWWGLMSQAFAGVARV